MVKTRLLTIAILFCVSTLSISVINATQGITQTKRSTAVRRQQALVKRINQGALRFYRTFIRQTVETTAIVDSELNDLLEDLLLAVDGLIDPRYTRYNLVAVMQIASNIERELLGGDISADVILAWSSLHADVDRLAKMNGIRWSETVVTRELIAALVDEIDTISKKLQSELLPFHAIAITTSADLPVLLSKFRSSAQELNYSSVDHLRRRIEAVTNYARTVTAAVNNRVISLELGRDWRRLTSQLEELVRLYSLDSIDAERANLLIDEKRQAQNPWDLPQFFEIMVSRGGLERPTR